MAIRTVTVRRLENSIRTDIEIFQYFKGTIDDINVIPLKYCLNLDNKLVDLKSLRFYRLVLTGHSIAQDEMRHLEIFVNKRYQ